MERILIARDMAGARTIRLLAAALASDGYELYEAYDGVTALETTRRKRPALVIADVLLPRLDGVELCRAIKADAALAGTRAVVLVPQAHDASDAGRPDRTSPPLWLLGSMAARLTRRSTKAW